MNSRVAKPVPPGQRSLRVRRSTNSPNVLFIEVCCRTGRSVRVFSTSLRLLAMTGHTPHHALCQLFSTPCGGPRPDPVRYLGRCVVVIHFKITMRPAVDTRAVLGNPCFSARSYPGSLIRTLFFRIRVRHCSTVRSEPPDLQLGSPTRIRTWDPSLNRRTLLPTELPEIVSAGLPCLPSPGQYTSRATRAKPRISAVSHRLQAHPSAGPRLFSP
jgi:hypothetical protein